MSFLRHFRHFSVGPSMRSSQQLKPETFWQKYRRALRENPLPIWAGLLVVGILQYRRIRRRDQELERSGRPPPSTNSSVLAAYESLPLAAFSRLFGAVSQVELPMWARKSILSWYVKRFGCDLGEACQEDVTKYSSMTDLFTRELKEGARTIDSNAPLTAPCDGKVLSCGPIDEYGYLEQIKGMSYPLRDFIGPYLPDDSEKKLPPKLFHITLYLAPGDYHHFHSPADWSVSLRRHYTGKLLSVGVWAAKSVPRLFVMNERAVYIGKWSEGFFSMIAVGATNVGSIQVEFDRALKTNVKRPKFACDEITFPSKISVEKGQHFGMFNLGSTIVLVFEAPESFRFGVEPGQRVLMGQALGTK